VDRLVFDKVLQELCSAIFHRASRVEQGSGDRVPGGGRAVFVISTTTAIPSLSWGKMNKST
jgi:hypothetical protein